MGKPDWLTIRPASTEKYSGIKHTIESLGLHTVCTEARCPNTAECWSSGTATFLILGGACTRGCRFCSVPKRAHGDTVDAAEPAKLARVISEWRLPYAVLTSVCRDDLPDQGSNHFAECIRTIKQSNPKTVVEVLIPDFRCDENALRRIIGAGPDVIGHNVETVESLSSKLRDARASYSLSLRTLKKIKALAPQIYTKSAFMLGLGESERDILQTMRDLRKAGVDFLAIGQYLSPGATNVKVADYIEPEEFERCRRAAAELGFLYVASGPFVRSSYKSGEYFARMLTESKFVSA